VERVEEWARRAARVPVRRIGARSRPRLPGPAEILVGGADAVRDLGVGGLDLVGVLDVDLAERRPGLAARERAVATWMEAIGWARPTGRAIVQASRVGDPAVQALVRGNPGRFAADETERRRASGFPVGSPVFRVAGSDGLAEELERFAPITMLVSAPEGQTVCLLALRPDQVSAFGEAVRELAAHDVVTRVEAEPHL
jgi:primosomal protein N' (replication factor Y)